MLEIAILKNFDSGTYKAGVQLAGSLTTYFDGISVAKNIPSSALVIGNYVILAIPGGNPRDACVIAAWPQGSPGANKLNDIGDVSVASPTDGDFFYYDGATSLWKAKAFPGYKKVTSAVTYNIGSGQDYATVAAAAADLRSLLLEANITLKLMENVTETALVEIKGQVSMGGALRIELNGKTWTLSGDLYPKVFVGGLANVVFQTQDAANGTIDIQHPSPAGKYPFQIRQMGYIRLTWLAHISVDFNNLAFAGFLQFLDNSSGYSHSNVNFLNSGNLVNVARMSLLSRLTFNWAFPGPWLIDGGGMVIDQNGDIWTSKGKVT
jgi:phage baseplate assembly protein gpV